MKISVNISKKFFLKESYFNKKLSMMKFDALKFEILSRLYCDEK